MDWRWCQWRQGRCCPRAAKPARRRKREMPSRTGVMKSLSNEFFLAMENGARTHQKSNQGEYDLVANGVEDEQVVAAQITLPPDWVPDSISAAPLPPTSLQ